ncbi:NAD(P)H-binding protein [Xylocopilactobacillus apicola]|uniref:Short-chain dehydrogenase n=1 Tax=Xylocopilactobacillus apicola TaxID=2932184 RepID=A0AAU9D282_9LACO|nr:NAD(P)H-binding protein [Xylocopilactobacillus apicola]BDR57834.1 short-chain dehydrogenase [Xylocopilactobacillus apicola]
MNLITLGANGQIAKIVRQRILAETQINVTSYLRNAKRLGVPLNDREKIVEGDVNDYDLLVKSLKGQDLVYANLGGVFEPMAKNIVKAMDAANVKRLIYVTGLGLYHELPAKFDQWLEASIGHETMEDTRRAASLIENSDLNYTIIRAGYMTDAAEIDYELTEKGETFKGTTVSRQSIADLIVKIIKDPSIHSYSSLGIAKAGTDGDSPVYI